MNAKRVLRENFWLVLVERDKRKGTQVPEYNGGHGNMLA